MEEYKDVDDALIQKDFGFKTDYLAIGVDRIDYTKGIPERLKIIDRFFFKKKYNNGNLHLFPI